MNPTQIFEFAMNWINQKIVKFNWVPLGQNRARPNRTVRAWPMLAALARPLCAAHGLDRRSVHGPARPARATLGARCERGARRRCLASRRRHGAGARETDEERAAHRRGDGGAAWHRRASSFGRDDGAVSEAVGVKARSARRSGRRRRAVGAGARAGLLGRAVPTAALRRA
jgi:hypothetical protein